MSTETPKKAPTGLGWEVKEFRNGDGTLKDCFVAAPRSEGMAYGLEVLGDDYTGYGDVEGKFKHCQMIVAWANAAAPVSAEPVVVRDLLRRAKTVLQLVDKDKGSTICTGGLISDISTYLAASVAAQAQQVDRSTEMQGKPVDESPDLQSQQQPVSGADDIEFMVRVLDHVSAWLPEDWSEFLERNPDVLKLLLPMVNHQTQQDADKVDAALAEMVHAMFRSGNSVPVTRITIDRKQYDAAIDAARKEQA